MNMDGLDIEQIDPTDNQIGRNPNGHEKKHIEVEGAKLCLEMFAGAA